MLNGVGNPNQRQEQAGKPAQPSPSGDNPIQNQSRFISDPPSRRVSREYYLAGSEASPNLATSIYWLIVTDEADQRPSRQGCFSAGSMYPVAVRLARARL